MPGGDALTDPIPDTTHQTFGPVEIDLATVGDARIRRCTYPPGMRWSTDLKPLLDTDLCEHAHIGFLARGDEPAVVIEVDLLGETATRLGLATEHLH